VKSSKLHGSETWQIKKKKNETSIAVSRDEVWYGILGFNVPLDTVQVISETGRDEND